MAINVSTGLLAILGFLGGSLGTIVLTKLFESFSEKRLFKQELKRQFFTKKLEAAESAIKYYASCIDAYNTLQNSIKVFGNGNMSSFVSLFGESSRKFQHLMDIRHDQYNMASLYFDIKPIVWYPSDNASKALNCFSEIIMNEEKTRMRLASGEDDLIYEERYATLKKKLEDLEKCFDIEKRKNEYYIKAIRDELKKHST